MAIIRNTASALRRGKVGNESYFVSLNRQVVRVAQNDSNYGETASRTASQQGNRVRWANLVQFYKLSKGWMARAFENKKSGQSDYNRFMQLNLANARIYFTKAAVGASACIIDEFTVSQGSLRSINIQQVGNTWSTDIQLGNLTIGSDTTIAEFSAAVLNANNWAREGMQISFISYQQQTDAFGFPVAICTAYEVTLSTTDTRLLRNFLPEFCSQTSTSKCLGTNSNISIGGFTYILSQTVGGKTLVSTQQLVSNNAGLIQQYSSDRMRELAMFSYGLNGSWFLDSGSDPVTRSEQPQYITSIQIGNNLDTFRPNGIGFLQSNYKSTQLKINLSSEIPAGATLRQIRYTIEGGAVLYAVNTEISADRKSITGELSASASEAYVSSMVVELTSYTINCVFNNSGVTL